MKAEYKVELMTIAEVAKLLHCSTSKLYKLTMRKKIEHIKLFDGGIRFKKESIYNMIEKNTIKPKMC